MKHPNLIGLFLAFSAGQLIQLLTNAVAHNLYVSDPVLLCLTVGIAVTVMVVLASMFTLMEKSTQQGTFAHERREKEDTFLDIIPPIFSPKPRRPKLDTNPENIDEIDLNLSKEK